MIRSVLSLRPPRERVDEVLEVYRDEKILQFSLDNSRAVASEISIATDGSGEVMVTALWPDLAAYQEWLNHPRRQRQRLVHILDGVEIGGARLFEVDHAVRKA